MQMSALGAEWLDRGDGIGLWANLQMLGRSGTSQYKAQDAEMLQLLCSVASKMLRYLCNSNSSRDSSSSSSRDTACAAEGPRVVAACLVAHVLAAITPFMQCLLAEDEVQLAASAKLLTRVLDDTGEHLLQIDVQRHHHHQITKLSHSINAIGPAPHRGGRKREHRSIVQRDLL
jgi:hypothetical protein